MARISHYFPLAHEVPRMAGGWSAVSGTSFVTSYSEGCSKAYGPHKTLYNRFVRWSRLGVIDQIFAALAGVGPSPNEL